MKIRLNTAENELPPGSALHRYAIRQIKSTLHDTRQYFEEVIVRITGVNNLSGSADKMCSVCVSIPGQTPVYATSYGNDIFHVISAAANRAGQKSRRRIAGRLKYPER